MTRPTVVQIYLSDISSNVVVEVIKQDDTKQLVVAWYLQPNLIIRESLAYAIGAPTHALSATGLYVAKDYGQEPILDPDPLFDYARLLDFDWHSYGIFGYVLHANVVLSC